MNDIFELEYRGLNLLDEISIVEVAIDKFHKVIHIYDTNHVVEPEFNFSISKYQMSAGFYKMAKILFNKQFFESQIQTEQQWINEITWVFYGSKKSILLYESLNIIEIPKAVSIINGQNKEHHLYSKYLFRVI